MVGTFWSLVPAIVAIALALITKEVYSSLFVGIIIGALFYAIDAASGFAGFSPAADKRSVPGRVIIQELRQLAVLVKGDPGVVRSEVGSFQHTRIKLDPPIKTLGGVDVAIKLHADVTAKVKVWVVRG